MKKSGFMTTVFGGLLTVFLISLAAACSREGRETLTEGEETELAEAEPEAGALSADGGREAGSMQEMREGEETGGDLPPDEPGAGNGDEGSAGSGGDAMEDGISEEAGAGADISGNDISGNDISGNSVSGDRVPAGAFLHRSRMTVSAGDVSGNGVSGNHISGNSISGNDVSGNDISENGISENEISDDEASENDASGNGASGNRLSKNEKTKNGASEAERAGEEDPEAETEASVPAGNMGKRASVSGNARKTSENRAGDENDGEDHASGGSGSSRTASGNAISGNSISGNNVSGNSVSDNGASGSSVSGNAVSGNGSFVSGIPASLSGNAIMTLAQRQKVRSSHKETLLANEKDRATISGNSLDFTEIRIACLGDSITEGSNLEQLENYRELAYPAALENALNAEKVYNLGIGGSSIGRYWADAFVDRYRAIPEDTDLILVMGGTNDGFCAGLVEFGTSAERKERTFWGDLDELMEGLKRDYPDAEVIFLTPLPNSLHDFLKKDHPYLISQEKYAEVIHRLAEEHGIEVIDLYNSNILDGHDKDNALHLMPDGVHPNAEGYRILGEHVAAEIIRLLEQRREEGM